MCTQESDLLGGYERRAQQQLPDVQRLRRGQREHRERIELELQRLDRLVERRRRRRRRRHAWQVEFEPVGGAAREPLGLELELQQVQEARGASARPQANRYVQRTHDHPSSQVTVKRRTRAQNTAQ